MNSSALRFLARGLVSAVSEMTISIALKGRRGGRSIKFVAYSYEDSNVFRSCVRVHLLIILIASSLSRNNRSTVSLYAIRNRFTVSRSLLIVERVETSLVVG